MAKIYLLCNYCTLEVKKWDGAKIEPQEKQ